MRVILGSILVSINLFASYSWSIKQDKYDVYANESVYIEYEVVFSDDAYSYAIEFNPALKTKNYTLIPYSQKEFLLDEKRHNRYGYIIQAKNSIEKSFGVTMKSINSQLAREGTLGRDNDVNEYLNAKKENLLLEPIVLNVKDNPTQIYGTFQLHMKVNKSILRAYEPLHVELTLSGIGNFNDILPFSLDINGTKIFADDISKQLSLTKNGYSGKVIQRFTISSKESFTLPSFKLRYFDSTYKSIKTISTKPLHVKISQISKKQKAKSIEKREDIDYFSYIYYLLTFILGFLSALLFKRFIKTRRVDLDTLEKIKSTKNINELKVLLISLDEKRFASMVEKEDDFKELKKSALKAIHYI
jgi:hypothetical protein